MSTTARTDHKPRRIRRHPDVATWRLIAWCLLMGLIVSLTANAALGWLFWEATRPFS